MSGTFSWGGMRCFYLTWARNKQQECKVTCQLLLTRLQPVLLQPVCVARYTLAMQVPVLQADDPSGSTPSGTRHTLYFCALGYGNLTSLVNDPVLDPYAAAAACAPAAADCERLMPPNVDILVVLLNGLPLPLLVTTRPIKLGEQICYAFGRGYWSVWVELQRAVKQANEAAGLGAADLL